MNEQHLKFYLERNPFKTTMSPKTGELDGFVTCPVRLAFTYLKAPRKNKSGVEKFTTAMIIPAAADVKAVFAEAMNVGVATFGKSYSEGIKDGSFKFPFKRQSKLAEKGYKGFGTEGFYCEAASKYSVPIVDTKGQPIAADSPLVYPGMWALVSVNLFAYGKGVPDSTKGVGLGLRSIMKLADDEEFKGDGAAAVFGEIETLPGASNGAAKAPDTGSAFDFI